MSNNLNDRVVKVGGISVSNELPFVLFGGVNVLESSSLAFEVAETFLTSCNDLNIPFVFKASFDKANRSSIKSFRGPGLQKGIQVLADIKEKFNMPIITDIHEPDQAKQVAEVVDVIQLPAFLARQTDLILAIAKTSAAVNIKKPQFIAPHEIRHIIQKFLEAGKQNIMVCERGSCFGYNNLIVDMLGFTEMKSLSFPVIFDVTHSLQHPGGLDKEAGGRREQVTNLALAGMSQRIAGLFVEAHPEPEKALCDGPCALRLSKVKDFLEQVKGIDTLVKSYPALDTK